jgi:hypothetical protein
MMDSFYQGGHMINGCIWKDSMAEVEDMPRPTIHAIKDPFDFLFDQIHWAE